MPRQNSSASAHFGPHPTSFRISSLGIVGDGELVQTRLWPALINDASNLRVAVCGQRSATSLSGLPHRYYRIHSDNLLPMAALYDDGFLDVNAAWFIATTPEVHVVYILELAGLCGRVFVEKPIAASFRQARVLLPYASNRAAIYPVDLGWAPWVRQPVKTLVTVR